MSQLLMAYAVLGFDTVQFRVSMTVFVLDQV